MYAEVPLPVREACHPPDATVVAGHVTITVGCEPAKAQAAQRKFFVQDVALFEKANPGITAVGDDTNPSDDPTTFDAKPASGTMDNRT